MAVTSNYSAMTPLVRQAMSEKAVLESKRHMVLARFGRKEDLSKRAGDQVRVEIFDFGSPVTTAVSYDDVLGAAGSALSTTYKDVVLYEYTNFFRSPRKALDMRQGNTRKNLAKGTGKNMGQSIEAILHTRLLATATSIVYAGVGADALNEVVSKVSETELAEIVDYMRINNMEMITEFIASDPGTNTTPVHDCYVAVVPSRAVKDVMALTNFEDVEKYATKAGNQLLPKEFGRLKGNHLRFVEGGNWLTAAGAGAAVATSGLRYTTVAGPADKVDVDTIFILSADAFAYVGFDTNLDKKLDEQYETSVIYQEGPDSSDPTGLLCTFGWKANLGCSVIRAKGVVAYRVGTTAPTVVTELT